MKRIALGAWVALAVLAAPVAAAPEVKVRGLLDLGLVSSVKGDSLNRLTFGDSNFDPYRLRLFLDARLSPNLELHAQTILHEGMSVIRADGAYALWTPWLDRDLSLEAGKIPWPIGTYAPRTYSDVSSFIGTPAMGFVYDPVSNSVIFAVPPPPGSTIKVTYTRGCS